MRVLNVGGNSKAIPLPSAYEKFEHILLDIDPKGKPDLVCDARQLTALEPHQFDAVYCSHNLEHYFAHDVRKVLDGFLHVLKPGGFAQVIVPDLAALMEVAVSSRLDVEDTLYVSPGGPISVLDVLYGWRKKIEETNQDYFAHKTGFTSTSLVRHLKARGFDTVYCRTERLEVDTVAFKGPPEAKYLSLLGLAAPS